MIIPSYLLFLLISRKTNFSQSSTIQRIGEFSKFDIFAFSLAQETILFDASTWQTFAPAFAEASVAPPVDANQSQTFIFLFSTKTANRI